MRDIFIFLLIIGTIPLQGQTLERWLIGSGGHLRTSPNIHLSGTAGESVVGYSESPDFNLSIGFQQGNSTPVGISEIISDNYSLKVFPIPASDEVMVDMSFTGPEDVHFSIFSITGSKLFKTEGVYGSNHIKKGIDVSYLPSGIYMLLINISGKESISIKIQKIN